MAEQKNQFETEIRRQRETFEKERDTLQRQRDAEREEKEQALRHMREMQEEHLERLRTLHHQESQQVLFSTACLPACMPACLSFSSGVYVYERLSPSSLNPSPFTLVQVDQVCRMLKTDLKSVTSQPEELLHQFKILAGLHVGALEDLKAQGTQIRPLQGDAEFVRSQRWSTYICEFVVQSEGPIRRE